MSSIDLTLLLAALVAAYAVSLWALVHLRKSEVKMAKVKFDQDRLRFARQQHDDMVELQQERLRHVAQQNDPFFGRKPH